MQIKEMLKRVFFLILCVLANFAIALNFYKVSFADEAFELERIVVTPSRIEESSGDVARNIKVINSEDIASSSVDDLAEVLDSIASLDISNYGGLGATKTIRMRGSSAAQVLILIDGRPINNPRDGQAELSNIPLADVERIELIRGPGSSMYGSSAMAGTVNIITKKPPRENTETEIYSSFGTYHTYIERLSHGGRVGKLGYLLSAEYYDSEGYRDNSEFRAKDFNLKLEYDLDKNNGFSINSGFYRGRLGTPGTLSSPDADDKQITLKNFFDVGCNLEPADSLGISAKIYQNYDRLEFLENTAGSVFDTANNKDIHTTKVRGFNLQLNPKIFGSYDLVCGFDYVANLNDSTTSAKHEYLVRAGYLENKLRLLDDRLHLNVGARIDDYSNFGTEINPAFSALYKLDDNLKLRGLISRSFRAPTFNDLYWPDQGWIKGNPNVKPEKGITGEAGLEARLVNSLISSLTYYRNDYDDLINWAEENGVWEPKNVGSALIDGIEFSNNLRLTATLEANLDYSYMRAKDDKADKYLIYQPKHKLDFSLKYNDFDGLSLTLKTQFTDKRYHDAANTIKVKRFYLLGIDISKKISKAITCFLSIDNILNKKYQVIKDYPMPGFRVDGGFKLEF